MPTPFEVQVLHKAGYPCTAGYLQDHGIPTPSAKYHRYTIQKTGEPVYHLTDTDTTILALESELQESSKELTALFRELELEYGEAEGEMNRHIERLHVYNEVKDAVQALLGRLADFRGTTTRSLYADFDLEISD